MSAKTGHTPFMAWEPVQMGEIRLPMLSTRHVQALGAQQ